jgi:hypothetical protein
VKKTPPAFLALGCNSPPNTIALRGQTYQFAKTFKHDFFAATTVYQSDQGQDRVIVKFGRTAPFYGIPLAWIGRLLAANEERFLKALSDLTTIPEYLGRYQHTAIIRRYIAGDPLNRNKPVPDQLFAKLSKTIDEMHARRMAYVDLEKPQNVIQSQDGRPYLIDFQISWFIPKRYGGDLLPLRWIRNVLQQSDRYHLIKLKRRFRPDLLTDLERSKAKHRPFYIRLHRVIARPLLAIRRAFLKRIDPNHGRGERGTVT